jgi:DNA-binding beta-propeller fold protein YncE
MIVLGYGDFRYTRDDTWPKAPRYWNFGFPSNAAINGDGEIFVISRGIEHPVSVWDRDGNFLYSWGAGEFSQHPHGITIAPNGNVWVVDRDYHVATEYSPGGQRLRRLGRKGQPSPTWNGRFIKSIPFNMPTNLAIAPDGCIFVSDGYGNQRVHKFNAEGKLLLSWGKQGTGRGEFALVHNVWVDSLNRVLVNDDENDRIQLFNFDGQYLEEWQMMNPSGLCVHNDTVFVSQLSPAHDPANGPGWGAVSIWNLDGERLSEWIGSAGTDRRMLVGPHDLCVDSEGSIYVCEGRIGRVSKFRRL